MRQNLRYWFGALKAVLDGDKGGLQSPSVRLAHFGPLSMNLGLLRIFVTN